MLNWSALLYVKTLFAFANFDDRITRQINKGVSVVKFSSRFLIWILHVISITSSFILVWSVLMMILGITIAQLSVFEIIWKLDPRLYWLLLFSLAAILARFFFTFNSPYEKHLRTETLKAPPCQ